ncbi:MAG TPA: ABC transporter ATP-binding protein [Solirubrobacteraceae bacterium]|nr:ABC transporter ATP-binding protein [Solirubrobacteraceae bacterium]
MFRLASGQRVSALDRLSLTIAPHEFVCVVGPSGHGKSTLLNLIAGFTAPTSGRIMCQGRPVTAPGPDRGVVFQADTLFMWRRVAGNIAYGLTARHVPRPEREATVARLLELVGLTEFARAWPKQLSGGMRRRVTLATVFANEPDVLLMDEPFTGLDYARRAVLHQVLVDLWRRAGNTVLLVTHNLEEALTLADRIVVMIRGRVVDDFRLTAPAPRDPQALLATEVNEVRFAVLEHLKAAMNDVETEVAFPEMLGPPASN